MSTSFVIRFTHRKVAVLRDWYQSGRGRCVLPFLHTLGVAKNVVRVTEVVSRAVWRAVCISPVPSPVSLPEFPSSSGWGSSVALGHKHVMRCGLRWKLQRSPRMQTVRPVIAYNQSCSRLGSDGVFVRMCGSARSVAYSIRDRFVQVETSATTSLTSEAVSPARNVTLSYRRQVGEITLNEGPCVVC